jgi:hypothetical protein
MATGATAIYQIPYPLPTDQVDVAGDFEQLAVKIDDNLNEWVEDITSTMITGGTYSNGINTPTYNDTTGLISMTLSQDLRSTASPTFNNLNLSGSLYLTGSILTPSVIDVTSSTDALRITQKGTGNALLIEDSANPDSNPFVIDNSGKVISGYTSAISTRYGNTSITPRSQVLSPNSDHMLLADHSSDALPSAIYGAKSRSTDPAIKQTVLINDSLFRISAAGDDGTLFTEAARIEVQVDAIPSTNQMPGRITFSTTPILSNTPVERMRINNSGYVGIGKTNPATTLDVFGTITGSAGSFDNLVGTTGTVTTFNATSITSPTILTSTPTSSNQATTKAYVDNLAGSIAPEIVHFDDISTAFDGQKNRFFLTNNVNGTRIFKRTNFIADPSFEGVAEVKYKTYNVGDVGPSGGLIFITPSSIGNNTGKYFEASPDNLDGSTNIVADLFKTTVIPGADQTIIGTGLQNTLDIIQATTYNSGEIRTFTDSANGIAANVVDGQGVYWTKPSGFTQDEVNQFNSMNGKLVNGTYLENYSRKNLIANPSFEVNTTNWNNQASTIARSTEDKVFGNASCLVTQTATLEAGIVQANPSSLVIGLPYTLSFYIRSLVNIQNLKLFVSQPGSIGVGMNFTQDPADGWVRRSITFTSQSTSLFTFIYNQSVPINGEQFYVDGFMLEQSSTLRDYFDGTTTNQINGYDSISWDGTANNSTSTMSAYRTTASKSFAITPVITARSAYGSYPATNATVAAGDTILFTSTSTSDFTATSITDGFRLPSCKFMWNGTSAADINAANLARAYSLNGYSDWYLPSKNELSQLYSAILPKRIQYPGINYWSTSTFNEELPFLYAMNFAGYPEESYRGQFFVRPIRSFLPTSINGSTSHSIEKIGDAWIIQQNGVVNAASSISRTYSTKYIGNSSMKVITNGSLIKQGVTYAAVSLSLNTTYTFSSYINVESGSPVNVIVYDGQNNVLSQSLSTSSASWNRISTTFSTQNDPSILISIVTDSSLAATTFYVDAVLLEQTNQLMDYFDGSNLPTSAGRVITAPSWSGTINNSISTVQYYESGEFKPTNPERLQLSICGILQTVSYPQYAWHSMFPMDGFTVDSDGYVTFSEAPTRGSKFDAKYIAGNNAVAETNKRNYPFKAIDILLGS